MGHDDRARESCRRDGAHKVSWEGVKEPDDPALQSMLCKYFLDHRNKIGFLLFSGHFS